MKRNKKQYYYKFLKKILNIKIKYFKVLYLFKQKNIQISKQNGIF